MTELSTNYVTVQFTKDNELILQLYNALLVISEINIA
jgi:hypothetical protein